MLTPYQIAQFETFGFLMLPQLFSSEEVALMRREAVGLLPKLPMESGRCPRRSHPTSSMR